MLPAPTITIKKIMTANYEIANFGVSLTLPDGLNVDALLPSFVPFKVAQRPASPVLHITACESLPFESYGTWEKLLNEESDMGRVSIWCAGDMYSIQVLFGNDNARHILLTDNSFSNPRICVDWSSRYAGNVLCSMVRLAFSQAIIRSKAVSVHASCVLATNSADGADTLPDAPRGAYLFMGVSGTGKSTHSQLWMEAFHDVELLNDDNPIVRVEGEQVNVYGSPWSGKTPCYKKLSAPVRGIARLQQFKSNAFIPASGVDAFSLILPGCAALQMDAEIMNDVYDTLSLLCQLVPVAQLRCLPNLRAAHICRESFFRAGRE